MRFSFPLILLGIVLLTYSGFLIYQRVNPWRLSFDSYNAQRIEKPYTSNNPTEVIIEDLKIQLPIRQAKKEGKKWQAFSDAVSYLNSSPIPGEQGNSILYGHNWRNLLGNLTGAKVGQDIKIRSSDGSEKIFKIKYIQEVTPDQTAILDLSSDTRITLYTCSGFLDSKRFVVVATLI